MNFSSLGAPLRLTAAAAVLALLGSAAQAQVTSMEATGSYALDGASPTLLSSTYPPNASVDVLDFPNTAASQAGLHSYGDVGGSFGSRSSGAGVYQVSGGFKLVETITNTTGVAQHAAFNFNITPGMLQNSLGAALLGSDYVNAGLSFNITLAGNSIWSSAATLRTDAAGTQFHATGDTSLYAGADTFYNVLGGSHSLDLGVLNAGESAELSYEIKTFADGVSHSGDDRWVDETTFIVPEGWDVWGSCGYNTIAAGCGEYHPGDVVVIPGHWVYGIASGSHASSGDPFSVDFGGGIRGSVNQGPNFGQVVFTTAVPEPETYALMLAGLGLIAGARLRRRNGV